MVRTIKFPNNFFIFSPSFLTFLFYFIQFLQQETEISNAIYEEVVNQLKTFNFEDEFDFKSQ